MSFNSNPAQPRKRGRSCLGCGAAVLIALLAVFGLYLLNEGWDALVDAPWAYALNGRPTLTGSWTGKFTAPGGIQFAVLLDLHRARNASGNFYNEKGVGPHINGQAEWCDSLGRHIDNVPIGGNVPPKLSIGYRDHVEQFHLVLEYKDPPPSGGLLPHEFNGDWQVDTLTTHPKFGESNGRNLVVTSSDSDPADLITVVFKKGDQNSFDALCKELSGTNS
jgi:hypothetical protein